MALHLLTAFTLSILLTNVGFSASKSTIEPCSTTNTCTALLGYTLPTSLKVSQVSSLFQIDPISLLTANSIDISYPDVENHILPPSLFLKIPITCSCVDGIRKSVSTKYTTRPSDTLSSIASAVYSGLVSADQLKDANSISDPSALDVGQTLVVPLPCVCFNGTDNSLPAVYMSYVVQEADSLSGIAASYSTTVSDLMDVNALGGPAINAGDILAIPLSACASSFPQYASDYGLNVPNGSYAITASHCVECSCAQGSRNLYCMPSSLAVSCSSMQCSNSNLMLGNVTWQQSSAGCNVTSCSYDGYANGTILTTLSTSLQPRCPGIQQFPPLIAPPDSVPTYTSFSPAPGPSEAGGAPTTTPTSTVPSSGSVLGLPPTNAPGGGLSSAAPLVHPLASFPIAVVVGLIFGSMRSLSL
ncbi:lysM domain-containing GPI-anchored protein 1 [Rhododendron vialii]|uniref:lysM domain-containing GPI-anchored protein 1 n=1 Tax=Rhododendron vialii TaxID=182163 RepID=UPI00265D7478|nr:lysM domain-containing GPI-anchored protein 1 [Rhododendron vialii]